MRWVGLLVAWSVALAGLGCGGSTSPGGAADGGAADGGEADGIARDAATDQASSNPCEAGTCRFSGESAGPCLPPGGPIAMGDSGTLSGCCGCGSDGLCSSPCVCASPDTPIATPSGDRTIASLAVGDVILSIDHGQVAAVPILATRRAPVSGHRVMEVVLRGGTVLRISSAHPTADGRSFGELVAGDWLGGQEVVAVSVVPYQYDATFDVLPDSDTATYFAGGALIGSTLARVPTARSSTAAACMLPPECLRSSP